MTLAKGALIGAALCADAGTVGAAYTGEKEIVLPAESALSFKLTEPVKFAAIGRLFHSKISTNQDFAGLQQPNIAAEPMSGWAASIAAQRMS
jgi:hypothetical protein